MSDEQPAQPQQQPAKPKGGSLGVPFFLVFGVVIGLLIGYQLNVESASKARADAVCGEAQQNVETMVKNFNILVRSCPALTGQVQNALPNFTKN